MTDMSEIFFCLKRLVQLATPEALKRNEEERTKREQDHWKFVNALKKEAEAIKDINLVFEVKTGEKGEVFGSVTEKDIEKAFHEKGFSHIAIKEKHVLKSVGSHSIKVNLGEGVTSQFTITLKPEE